jgi:hypothetical protein
VCEQCGDPFKMSFDAYLRAARQEKFWVGGLFFAFFFAMTGIDVISFEPSGFPTLWASMMIRLAMKHLNPTDPIFTPLQTRVRKVSGAQIAFVLFHRYGDPMTVYQEGPSSSYNHFCALIPQFRLSTQRLDSAPLLELNEQGGLIIHENAIEMHDESLLATVLSTLELPPLPGTLSGTQTSSCSLGRSEGKL